MKNLLPIIIFCAALCSCNKEDASTPITKANVSETLSSGTWRITYFFDSNQEKTSNFTGYNFTFSGNDTLRALKSGLQPLNGTWATGTDNITVKLALFFNTPANFTELNEDWDVTERSNNRIKLKDVSGGNGSTDLLTFEKN